MSTDIIVDFNLMPDCFEPGPADARQPAGVSGSVGSREPPLHLHRDARRAMHPKRGGRRSGDVFESEEDLVESRRDVAQERMPGMAQG